MYPRGLCERLFPTPLPVLEEISLGPFGCLLLGTLAGVVGAQPRAVCDLPVFWLKIGLLPADEYVHHAFNSLCEHFCEQLLVCDEECN